MRLDPVNEVRDLRVDPRVAGLCAAVAPGDDAALGGVAAYQRAAGVVLVGRKIA